MKFLLKSRMTDTYGLEKNGAFFFFNKNFLYNFKTLVFIASSYQFCIPIDWTNGKCFTVSLIQNIDTSHVLPLLLSKLVILWCVLCENDWVQFFSLHNRLEFCQCLVSHLISPNFVFDALQVLCHLQYIMSILWDFLCALIFC